ncbi:MAG TPA: hypothetical protein VF950_07935 [Planctomycetota bacterium]
MLMELVLGLLLAQEGDKKAPVKEGAKDGGQGPMLQVAEVDTNGDGWISAQELKIALGKLGGGGDGQKDGFKKPGGVKDGEGAKKPGAKDGDGVKKPLGEGDAPVKKKPAGEGDAPPVKKPAGDLDAPAKKKPVKEGEKDGGEKGEKGEK